MARAVIAIVDPQSMLDDQANGYLPDDVTVDMGEDPNTTVIEGERDAVLRFLTDDLGVDPDEANEYIDREEMEEMDEGGTESTEGGDTCPDCGAPAGMPCDSGCPNAEQPEPDPDRYREGVAGFDKFMDKILISEGNGRKPTPPEDNPQRRRAARHQDRPGNKIRYGVK